MIDLIEKAKVLIDEKLKDHPKRLAHSYGVALTCQKLARLYGINEAEATLIGLFHDYAKYDTLEDQVAVIDPKIVRQYKDHPVIYHAYAASYWFTKRLGVDDERLISAINHHVWGQPDMNMLEKILFVADYCEPTRPFSDKDYIYALAVKKLDEAVCYCMKSGIDDLEKRGLTPSSQSLDAYHYYMEVTRGTTR